MGIYCFFQEVEAFFNAPPYCCQFYWLLFSVFYQVLLFLICEAYKED